MTKDKQDKLARAYAMLTSLRKNIDQMTSTIPETYVHEFNTVLTNLEGIGIDVSEFRIPDSEVAPRVTAIRTLTFREGPKAGTDYSKEKYVDKPYLLTKIDAILGYFEIITYEKPRRIGFTKSDSQQSGY